MQLCTTLFEEIGKFTRRYANAHLRTQTNTNIAEDIANEFKAPAVFGASWRQQQQCCVAINSKANLPRPQTTNT